MPGEAKALLAAALWATCGIVFAAQVRRLGPVALNVIRCSAAVLFICLLAPFMGAGDELRHVSAATVVAMIGTGILATGLGDSLFFVSLPTLGASLAVPVSSSAYPLLTLFIAAVWLGESVTIAVVAGSVLIVLGIFLLLWRTEPVVTPSVDVQQPSGVGVRAAVLLLMVATVFWTASTLWLRAGTGNLGPASAGLLRTGAAGAFLLAALRPLEGKRASRFDVGSAIWVAVAGIIGLGLGSLFYIAAVEEAGAGKTAVLTSTMPLFNLPLVVLFLKERVTPRIVFGTITCVAGISLII